jgi:ABC-type branched-subunit amino acid transport system ATPase component
VDHCARRNSCAHGLIGVTRQLREEGEMAIVLVEQYFDFAID